MFRHFKSREQKISLTIFMILTAALTFIITWSNIMWGDRYIVIDAKGTPPGTANKVKAVDYLINKRFYQDIDKEKYIDGMLHGMANGLGDPYSAYYTTEEMESFGKIMNDTVQEYVGIGVIIDQDEKGMYIINEIFEESPAKKAGLLAGDIFLKVNGKDATDFNDKESFLYAFKGESGTKVAVSMYRKNEDKLFNCELTVENIKHYQNILSKMMTDEIGYINIAMFDNEIAKNFKEQYNLLKEKNAKGLIIDLRNDPGGSYEQVIEIADVFINEGIIVYTEDKAGKKEYKYAEPGEEEIPLILLINEKSASASEVLAGAIRDHGKGKLVGKKTFGKGIVQGIFPFKDDSGIKMTTSKYFTPSGECIHEKGIEPDVEIILNQTYSNMRVSQIPENEDNQLNAALNLMTDMLNKKG